mgnify:CR=1 FL=1
MGKNGLLLSVRSKPEVFNGFKQRWCKVLEQLYCGGSSSVRQLLEVSANDSAVLTLEFGTETDDGWAVRVSNGIGLAIFERFDSKGACIEFLNVLALLMQTCTLRGKAINIRAKELWLKPCKVSVSFRIYTMLYVVSLADVFHLILGATNNTEKIGDALDDELNRATKYIVRMMRLSVKQLEGITETRSVLYRGAVFGPASLQATCVVLLQLLRKNAGFLPIPLKYLTEGGKWLLLGVEGTELALLDNWTNEQHVAFCAACSADGIKRVSGVTLDSWRKVADAVGSRTAAQVKNHAQVYFTTTGKTGGGNDGANGETETTATTTATAATATTAATAATATTAATAITAIRDNGYGYPLDGSASSSSSSSSSHQYQYFSNLEELNEFKRNNKRKSGHMLHPNTPKRRKWPALCRAITKKRCKVLLTM